MKKILVVGGLVLSVITQLQAESRIIDGRLYHNGKPTFMMGIYGSTTDNLEKKAMMDVLEGTAFNTFLMNQAGTPIKQWPEFLDYAQDKGLNVVAYADMNHPQYGKWHQQCLSEVGDHSALIAANIYDDSWTAAPSAMTKATRMGEQAAPDKVNFQSLNTSSWFYGYRNPATKLPYTDLFEIQAYTIAYGGARKIWDIVDDAVQKAQGQLVIPALQAFRWSDVGFPEEGTVWPTPQEIDVMSYLSLIAGGRSINYFQLKEYRTDLGKDVLTIAQSQPAQWASMLNVTEEIMNSELHKVFTWGQRRANIITDNLHYATWDYDGHLYLIVANSGSKSTWVEIPIDDLNVNDWMTNMFEHRQVQLQHVNNRMQGWVPSMSVGIFKATTRRSPITFKNASFEHGDLTGWIIGEKTPSGIFKVEHKSYKGNYRLSTQGSVRGYIYQTIKVPNGMYSVRANSHSHPDSESRLVVKKYGGPERAVKAAGDEAWPGHQLAINEIEVTNGQIEIGYQADDRGTWSLVDQFEILPHDIPKTKPLFLALIKPAHASHAPDQKINLIKMNSDSLSIDGQLGARDNQKVQLWPTHHNNINQQWVQIDRGNGSFAFRKEGTNFCLDGGAYGSDGQEVELWRCDLSSLNQRWNMLIRNDGAVQLQKANAPQYCINGGSADSAMGANIRLSMCNDEAPDQYWLFNTL